MQHHRLIDYKMDHRINLERMPLMGILIFLRKIKSFTELPIENILSKIDCEM